MSIQIELESSQVETLLRAGMLLKFSPEGGDDSELLEGSPIYASALSRLRDALIEQLRSAGVEGRARRYEEWYQLAYHSEHLELVARRAILHPRWSDLPDEERRSWIEVLAAPLKLDDESFVSVRSAADDLLGRG